MRTCLRIHRFAAWVMRAGWRCERGNRNGCRCASTDRLTDHVTFSLSPLPLVSHNYTTTPTSTQQSLEGLYQEAGRAGRDGLASRHVLFFSRADCARMERLIKMPKKGVGRAGKQAQLRLFDQVKEYCEDTQTCRRVRSVRFGYCCSIRAFERKLCVLEQGVACFGREEKEGVLLRCCWGVSQEEGDPAVPGRGVPGAKVRKRDHQPRSRPNERHPLCKIATLHWLGLGNAAGQHASICPRLLL